MERTLETRKKMSDTRIERGLSDGENNNNWKGGISGDIREYYRAYNKRRYAEDPCFKLRITMRNRLNTAIKSMQKNGSAVDDLGCSIPELKRHLESLFEPGMTWENWGVVGWHIDHQIALSFFDLTDRDDVKKALHFSNLQPMWSTKNISKGGRNRKSVLLVQ